MSLQCLRAKVLSVLMILAGIPALPAQPKDDGPQHLVEIRTSLGVLIVALYNETPLHRDNFLELVRDQYYDSLCFHRIIPGFMVQGGDSGSKHAAAGMPLGTGGPDYKIPAEILPGMYHKKGALAAARQGDQVNPAKESSGSQFYIVQGRTYQAAEMDMMSKRNANMGTPVSYDDEAKRTYATQGGAPHLDGAYTVFGEVIDGLDVLDRIAAVERDQHDRPLVDVRMWMKVLE
ncbi:MAG: peptidylprolyl isomerase [Flavobacteriales bacterium]|mgnify:CR=1 FL=1|nr:peptidylprolyl isomerase [Flavobacteriales bacterium]